jgi:hypothetical protein
MPKKIKQIAIYGKGVLVSQLQHLISVQLWLNPDIKFSNSVATRKVILHAMENTFRLPMNW